MFVLYLFILAVFHGANTQTPCAPSPVQGLQLDANGTLHWFDVTYCQINSYEVYIFYKDEAEAEVFNVISTFLDVTFLPACEEYRFVVTAISPDNVTSLPTILETRLPAFPDANITVSAMRGFPQPNNGFLLEWNIVEKWAHCVEYFRVVRWDGLHEPVDTYVTEPFILVEGLTPCVINEFTVVPIYNNDMEGGIGIVPFYTPYQVSPFPTLQSVRQGTTFIELTLGLPPYLTNPCPISAVNVDGSPFINLSVQIADSPARPPVQVRLDSLLPESMYQLLITVVNNAGASVPLPIAVQTLPPNE